MIYLSGAVRQELFGIENIGFMLTPNIGNAHPVGNTWAADSGLFSTKRAREFNLEKYMSWLEERGAYSQDCLFATAPDVVGDWQATKERSLNVLPIIRACGYKAALVAQDGLTDPGELEWYRFDCLFIGGTTEYKLAESTYALAQEAKRQGKHIHMGRVNSWQRLRAAAVAGFDSADGTIIAFGPDVNIPKVKRWINMLQIQQLMEI